MVALNEVNEFSALEEGRKSEVVDDDEFDGPEEEQMMTDINEAIILIKRTKTLIDYVSTPELCKAISKRERATMVKLSNKLNEFIGSVENSYGDTVGHDLSL